MTAPSWTPPRDWANGDTFTQARTQAFLADNFNTGPSAGTLSDLNALFGPEGAGTGAQGTIVIHTLGSEIVIPLVRTATSGWCSTDLVACVHGNTSTPDTGTAYVVTDRGPLLPFADIIAAGLKLQVRVYAYLNAGASSTEFVACLPSYGSETGASTDYVATGTNEVSSSSTSPIFDSNKPYADLAAGAITAIASSDYVALNLGNKRAGANAGNIRAGSTLFYRYTD